MSCARLRFRGCVQGHSQESKVSLRAFGGHLLQTLPSCRGHRFVCVISLEPVVGFSGNLQGNITETSLRAGCIYMTSILISRS